jgi:hypothetical protein
MRKVTAEEVTTTVVCLAVGAYLWFLWDMRKRSEQFNRQMVIIIQENMELARKEQVLIPVHAEMHTVVDDGEQVIHLAAADEPSIEDGTL